MSNSTRCLYNDSFEKFNNETKSLLFGVLCDNYRGNALTTTREAWKSEISIEISIMKRVLSKYRDSNGQIIFEYGIPRLGNYSIVVSDFAIASIS